MDRSIIEKHLIEFINSSKKEFIYPIVLNKKERLILHEMCENHKLFSESIGEGLTKKVIIRKEKGPIAITISDDDRNQFIKDFELPIPVYKEPYFSYFIELYNEMYDTKDKLAIFMDAISILKSEGKQLKKTSYEIMNKIVSEINSQPAYGRFTSSSNEYSKITLPNDINIWNVHNTNWPNFYISCDIKKANFHAMKFYDKSLVLNCDTWEQLIGKFTKIKYFIESKYFRQIVFGNLKGKRIGAIERYLHSYLYNEVKGVVNVCGKLSDDELIVKTTKDTIGDDVKKITEILNRLPENMQGIWRISSMYIEPLGTSPFFIKKTIIDLDKPFDDPTNFKVEIKCVGKDLYAQAYKFFKGQELTINDLKIMKDNFIVTYDEKYNFNL